MENRVYNVRRPNGPARKHRELQSQSLKLSVVLLALPMLIFWCIRFRELNAETEDLVGEETAKKKKIVFNESVPSTFICDCS